MAYHKPEIAVLGRADQVISNLWKLGFDITDALTIVLGLLGIIASPPPAYDLDE